MTGRLYLDSRRDGTTLLQHSDPEDWVLALAVCPKGQLMATGGRLDNICIWDVKRLALIRTFDPGGEEGVDYVIACSKIVFHPSLPYFAYIDGTWTICVVRTDTWDRVLTLGKTSDNILSIAFAPQAGIIA